MFKVWACLLSPVKVINTYQKGPETVENETKLLETFSESDTGLSPFPLEV